MCVLNHSDGGGGGASPSDCGRGCGRGGGGRNCHVNRELLPDTGAFGDSSGMQSGAISPGGREWASSP